MENNAYGEVYDPSHLDNEDLDLVRRRAEALQNGYDTMNDDPIERGLVNGYVKSCTSELLDDIDCEEEQQNERVLSPEQAGRLMAILNTRFRENSKRHEGIEWSKVKARLDEAAPEKLWSLNEMERTGGKPDVVDFVEETGEYEFWDTSTESPEGRRNVCYDLKGQEEAEGRGESPAGNAIDMAKDDMGLGGILDREQIKRLGGILDREQIKRLERLVEGFLSESYSWVDTPEKTRKREVALRARGRGGDVGVLDSFPYNSHDRMGFHGWIRV